MSTETGMMSLLTEIQSDVEALYFKIITDL